MTRYLPAFSWPKDIQAFLDEIIAERPLLNVCSGHTSWGDVNVDRYEPSDTNADWQRLPFADDAFAAVFADPPWTAAYKPQVSGFVNEALRIAPVAYLMAPWIYGASHAQITSIWVRQHPGVNTAILLTRYARGIGFDISRPYLDEQARLRTGSGTPSNALDNLPLFGDAK